MAEIPLDFGSIAAESVSAAMTTAVISAAAATVATAATTATAAKTATATTTTTAATAANVATAATVAPVPVRPEIGIPIDIGSIAADSVSAAMATAVISAAAATVITAVITPVLSSVVQPALNSSYITTTDRPFSTLETTATSPSNEFLHHSSEVSEEENTTVGVEKRLSYGEAVRGINNAVQSRGEKKAVVTTDSECRAHDKNEERRDGEIGAKEEARGEIGLEALVEVEDKIEQNVEKDENGKTEEDCEEEEENQEQEVRHDKEERGKKEDEKDAETERAGGKQKGEIVRTNDEEETEKSRGEKGDEDEVVRASDGEEDEVVRASDGEEAKNKRLKEEVKVKEEKGGELPRVGRVIYSAGPKDGETVWVTGKQETAVVQVVEQLHPSYQLAVSVKVVSSGSTSAQECRAEGGGRVKETPEGSLCLGKLEIKEALTSWALSPALTPDGIASPSEATRKTERDLAADISLRRWISTGRAPRRVHLVHWLLRRLELVEIVALGFLRNTNEKEQHGRKRWALEMSNLKNQEGDIRDAPPVQTEEFPDDVKDAGEIFLEQQKRTRITGSRSRKESNDETTQWWDNENPWERGSTSMIAASDERPDPPTLSHKAPPPYIASMSSPPPYREVAGLMSGSSEALGPPPSYRSTSEGGSAASKDEQPLSSNIENTSGSSMYFTEVDKEETEGQHETNAISDSTLPVNVRHKTPPPSYAEVYDVIDDPATNTINLTGIRNRKKTLPVYSSLQGGLLDSGIERGDNEQYRHHKNKREDERGRERERERRRRRSIGGEHMFDQSSGRPETTSGGLGLSRRWRNMGRSSTTTGGESFAALRWKQEQKKNSPVSSLRDKGNWDDERWRLARYLEACKRDLVEAEEQRRRAEATANMAEGVAGRNAGKPEDGADDKKRREWARTATQRVLDIMLVTERVGQEEQKMRVAAARANEQVIRCKQPFRGRRGRTQKGVSIGPIVPPKQATEPPRDPRVETAVRTFYWDEHGRRYSRGGHAGNDRNSDEVAVAMEAVRQVAAESLEEGIDFRQPFRELDTDEDGRLSLAELGIALRRAGLQLTVSQVTAIFRNFDEGIGSDTIGRGDFLWEFVDKRRILNQWLKAGNVQGGHRARTAPFRVRAMAGGGETLGRQDFYHALDELNIHVNGWEAKALLDRFEVDEDGEIDWREFVSIMQAAQNAEDGDRYLIRNAKANTESSNKWKDEISRKSHHKSHQRNHNESRDSQRDGNFQTLRSQEGNGISGSNNTRFRGHQTLPRHQARESLHNRRTLPRGGLFERGSTWNVPALAATIGVNRPRVSTVDPSATGQRTRNSLTMDSSSRAWEPSPPGSRGKGAGAKRNREREEFVLDATKASKMLDVLLDDQRELEAFLEEELAKRGTVDKRVDEALEERPRGLDHRVISS